MMRIEKDALGEVQVPEDRYFGAQTQRAIDNFRVGCERFPVEFIRAHALVKRAAAVVNSQMGQLDEKLAQAIIEAAAEVIGGRFDEHFPLVIWQSGSGTQFNMNMNEVIANRANEILGHELGSKSPVHPNDHVNMSQSTNDTIPTSLHIAAVQAIMEQLLPSLDNLKSTLERKAQDYHDIIKIGRTHLQDATPMSLGQEFSGYAYQLQQGRNAIEAGLDQVYELAIGGTAVGTGINTRVGFDENMVSQISEITGYPFRVAGNKFAALAAHDAMVGISGVLKRLSASLLKIANDIRWLAAGPRCGLGELILPANEPGSSIMPGKVNPTQCEMLSMVVCQVYGNDTAIALAGGSGNFELNVYKPLLVYTLIQSITLLADGMQSFNEKCVSGIEPNRRKIAEHLHNSLMLVTALNQHIGYDKSAEIALKAWREDKTLRQAAIELKYLTAEQFDEWLCPEKMIKPAD
ncbi:MAG: class II fumarate hydratase [Sedimentisphaerales bacterium]|nr:class II fumarate hydratase [Sedimentisphaerales bacterium]